MKKLEFVPTNYPSDLTEEQWNQIEHFIPVGNKSEWNKRSMVNAALYITKTGVQWEYLPHDYPPHGQGNQF